MRVYKLCLYLIFSFTPRRSCTFAECVLNFIEVVHSSYWCLRKRQNKDQSTNGCHLNKATLPIIPVSTVLNACASCALVVLRLNRQLIRATRIISFIACFNIVSWSDEAMASPQLAALAASVSSLDLNQSLIQVGHETSEEFYVVRTSLG